MSKRRLSDQQRYRINQQTQPKHNKKSKKEMSSPRCAVGTLQEGLVTARFGKKCEVENSSGQRLLCFLRPNMPPVVTGDRIQFQQQTDGSAFICALHARKSAITRTLKRGETKIIAANVNLAVLVIANKPKFQQQLIDRYLVNTQHLAIPTIIVFNKADLLSSKQRQQCEQQLSLYQQLAYPVVFTSCNTHEGMQQLLSFLSEKITVFIGQSGVGKSSLIQAMLPDEQLQVGELSSANTKGQHTTTTARLYCLKQQGKLIDSPGIRDLPLANLSPQELSRGFVEFQPLLDHCKFNNCRHHREPGCAIINAIESGQVCKSRHQSYLHILSTLT